MYVINSTEGEDSILKKKKSLFWISKEVESIIKVSPRRAGSGHALQTLGSTSASAAVIKLVGDIAAVDLCWSCAVWVEENLSSKCPWLLREPLDGLRQIDEVRVPPSVDGQR